jgi:hypothetical protein
MSEAFLGIRMPQKKRKLIPRGTTQQKMKSILKNLRLYTSTLYLFLMFPLGIIYFVGLVALFSSAVSLIVSPIVDTLSVPLLVELFEGT